MEIYGLIVGGLIAAVIAVFFRQPLQDWFAKKRRLAAGRKPRRAVQVFHVSGGKHQLPDFAPVVTAQNAAQNLFSFQVDDFSLTLTPAELRELESTDNKKAFMGVLAGALARARAAAPDAQRAVRGPAPIDLVLTNVPLPGYFYAWQTPDRRLVVVSTASVGHLFKTEGVPNLGDFVVRMCQRMALFADVSELEPREDHLDKSVGCLFDFTVRLERVVPVVAQPFLCHECLGLLEGSKGTSFAHTAEDWVVKSKPGAAS